MIDIDVVSYRYGNVILSANAFWREFSISLVSFIWSSIIAPQMRLHITLLRKVGIKGLGKGCVYLQPIRGKVIHD